jgi:hypothetical protein
VNVITHTLTFSLPRGYDGISFTYRGDFARGTQYYKNDVVFFTGQSYIALSDNIKVYPNPYPIYAIGSTVGYTIDTGMTIWAYICVRGTDGDKGDKGDKGDNGNDGISPSISDIVSAFLSAGAFVTLQGQVSTLQGEVATIQGQIVTIDANLFTLNTKTTQMTYVPNFGTYFNNLSIWDGASDYIKLYTDGTSMFRNTMRFRNGLNNVLN